MRLAPINDDDEAFIEAVASLFIPMGMLPIAARMNGYLLLRKDPMTLDELVEALGVSKSSASVATRILERYGIARRFTERGTKRVRYGISGWVDGYLAQQIQFLDSMAHLLKNRSAAYPKDPVSARLKGLSEHYMRYRDAINQVYNGPEREAPQRPVLVAISAPPRAPRQRRR